jgi:hypothetical protein
MEVSMAHKGIGYFDSRGHFFKTPEDATLSDLSMLLGRIGEGDSLAPGIAAQRYRTDIRRARRAQGRAGCGECQSPGLQPAGAFPARAIPAAR